MEDTLLSVIKESKIIPLTTLKLYIWQDECQDQFLLTREMEIFLWNKSTLKLYIFKPQSKKVLVKWGFKELIFDEIDLDEGFIECKTNIENLTKILSFSLKRKNRLPKRSKWILKMEKILAHRILPFYIHIQKDIKGEMPKKALEGLKKYRESKG
jgi:hypothetical protein